VVSFTPWLLYPHEELPMPILKNAGWTPKPGLDTVQKKYPLALMGIEPKFSASSPQFITTATELLSKLQKLCMVIDIFNSIHFILFTRSTFGGAALRYRTRPYKFKYHDKIQHVHGH
jgi:hypothetical protein